MANEKPPRSSDTRLSNEADVNRKRLSKRKRKKNVAPQLLRGRKKRKMSHRNKKPAQGKNISSLGSSKKKITLEQKKSNLSFQLKSSKDTQNFADYLMESYLINPKSHASIEVDKDNFLVKILGRNVLSNLRNKVDSADTKDEDKARYEKIIRETCSGNPTFTGLVTFLQTEETRREAGLTQQPEEVSSVLDQPKNPTSQTSQEKKQFYLSLESFL